MKKSLVGNLPERAPGARRKLRGAFFLRPGSQEPTALRGLLDGLLLGLGLERELWKPVEDIEP
jgi:hypothetical protein